MVVIGRIEGVQSIYVIKYLLKTYVPTITNNLGA